MISPNNTKRHYEVGHFTEDCVARDWLNEMFDQGYVVDALTSKVVPGRRIRGQHEVEFTIIMRLDLNHETPLLAEAGLRRLRDLQLDPDVLRLKTGDAA